MRAFIDTNILLYEVDRADLTKQARVIELLGSLGRNAVISTQVLQEFYNIAVKKLQFSQVIASQLTESYSKLEVVPSDRALVMQAISVSISAQISIWDALMVSAAEISGCKVLYSEDMNHGQVIRGVRIENPFIQPA